MKHEPADNPGLSRDSGISRVDSEARMNDTTWTPGPWRILEQVALRKVRFGVGTSRGVIIDADNEADARLIAAAPEMADILERWWEDPDNPPVDVPLFLSRIRGERSEPG
jgi:hypothetical protein